MSEFKWLYTGPKTSNPTFACVYKEVTYLFQLSSSDYRAIKTFKCVEDKKECLISLGFWPRGRPVESKEVSASRLIGDKYSNISDKELEEKYIDLINSTVELEKSLPVEKFISLHQYSQILNASRRLADEHRQNMLKQLQEVSSNKENFEYSLKQLPMEFRNPQTELDGFVIDYPAIP